MGRGGSSSPSRSRAASGPSAQASATYRRKVLLPLPRVAQDNHPAVLPEGLVQAHPPGHPLKAGVALPVRAPGQAPSSGRREHRAPVPLRSRLQTHFLFLRRKRGIDLGQGKADPGCAPASAPAGPATGTRRRCTPGSGGGGPPERPGGRGGARRALPAGPIRRAGLKLVEAGAPGPEVAGLKGEVVDPSPDG